MGTVRFKCTVQHLYKGCPKPDGWFGCFAKSKKYGNIKLTGKASFIVAEGMTLEIEAEQKDYDSFNAVDVKVYTKSQTAIVNYLASPNFAGIGYSTALKIYEHYGDNTIVMLRNHPEVVAKDVGLSDKQMQALTKGVNNPVADIKAIFPLFTAKQIKSILDRYADNDGKTDPNQIIKLINDNPYQLMEDVEGIPFKTVDDIALNILHFTMDDKRRLHFVIKYTVLDVLKQTGGNYINLSNNDEYGFVKAQFTRHLRMEFNDNWFSNIIITESSGKNPLIYVDVHNGEYHLYTMNGWNDQNKIIACIKDRLIGNDSNFVGYMRDNNENMARLLTIHNKISIKTTGHPISNEQLNAIENSLKNQISVITGGPGRGKTATINNICDIWESQCPANRLGRYMGKQSTTLMGIRNLILCAPTGRAAKNLSNHTGRAAFTIAKILTEMNTAKKSQNIEQLKAHLRNGLAIIDECSMISQHDMAEILELFTKFNMQIILVGDVNQLPPIESGRPFKDIIASGKVTVSKLTICFRTNIQIISDNADCIIAGSHKISWSPDFMFLNYTNEEDSSNILVHTFLSELQTKDIKEVALLCGIHTGKSGTNALNMQLQAQLNPQNTTAQQTFDAKRGRYYFDELGVDIPETYFAESKDNWSRIRVGDRVMRTENDYKIDRSVYDDKLEFRIEPGSGIFNGDCGTIIRYYPYVNEDKPAQIVVLLDDDTVSFIDCDPEEVNSCKLTLAYASTIHKAQGCEYRTVITSLPLRLTQIPNNFGSRNLLYTGVTRAKESVIMIGDQDALFGCIDTEPLPRNSNMAERI